MLQLHVYRNCEILIFGISFFIFSTRKITFECRLSSSLTPQEMCTIMILKYIFHTFPENQRNFQKKLPKKLVVPPPLFGICCWEFSVGFRKILQPPRWASRDASRSLQRGIGTFGEVCSGGEDPQGRPARRITEGKVADIFPLPPSFFFLNKYSLFETRGGVYTTALLVAWIITRMIFGSFSWFWS